MHGRRVREGADEGRDEEAQEDPQKAGEMEVLWDPGRDGVRVELRSTDDRWLREGVQSEGRVGAPSEEPK